MAYSITTAEHPRLSTGTSENSCKCAFVDDSLMIVTDCILLDEHSQPTANDLFCSRELTSSMRNLLKTHQPDSRDNHLSNILTRRTLIFLLPDGSTPSGSRNLYSSGDQRSLSRKDWIQRTIVLWFVMSRSSSELLD